MLNQELIDKEYGFLGEDIFLDVSRVVLPPKRVQDAYGRFMKDYVQSFSEGIVEKSWDIIKEARVRLARLINAEHPHEIGFVKNTAEGVSILAQGYPLKEGDNIVIADQEHQSVLFPWINVHQTKGINLHVVKSVNREVRAEDMIAAIDEHTKILAISAVQFSTGFLADLELLGAECQKRGVIFMVDGIQMLGRLKIDVQALHIDWLAAGGNKGLLGTPGAGFVYCSDRIVKDVIPPYAGYQSTINHVAPPSVTTDFETLLWHTDARRFESGNLSYNCIYALSLGVELILELGIDNIESHIRELEQYLRKQLADLNLPVVQAADPRNWGGIVCVYYPAEQEKTVINILKQHKIHATMRGGYIRLGIDFYNTQQNMETVSEALHQIAALL